MEEKISNILILDYKYKKKKNFKTKKLIFINRRAFILNKDIFIFNNFQVLRYSNFNRVQRKKKYLYLYKLHDEILGILVKKLNEINNIDFNKNQWNILIGSWLFYYLSACYNKYQKLEQAFKIQKNLNVYIEKPEKKIQTFSTEDFLKDINLNDFWNAEIYFQLLIEMKKKIILNIIKKKNYKKDLILGHKTSLKRKVISSILNFFFIKLSTNHSFISESYLSIFEEIKLNFKINGVPLFFATKRINFKELKNTKLSKLNNLLVKHKKEIFFNFINRNLISDVPEVFIKYFSKIYNMSLNIKWPTKPNTIFTSNLYETDELFKMYVAINNKKYNSNYIIGQHGNSYNIAIQSKYNPEIKFADKFLSWSSDKNSKNNFLSFGNFTNKNHVQKKKNISIQKYLNYFEIKRFRL